MIDLGPDRLRERLEPHDGELAREEGVARAAVAALLRLDAAGPSVLLMQRVQAEGDRWSGQISLPGGREEDGDGTLLDTAVRETLEEVGRDLAQTAEPVGRLPTRQAIARGRFQPMTVTPFVFVETAREPVALGAEADAAFWLRLDTAASGAYDDVWRWSDGRVIRKMPCWRVEDRVVWGMTYRMLSELLEL